MFWRCLFLYFILFIEAEPLRKCLLLSQNLVRGSQCLFEWWWIHLNLYTQVIKNWSLYLLGWAGKCHIYLLLFNLFLLFFLFDFHTIFLLLLNLVLFWVFLDKNLVWGLLNIWVDQQRLLEDVKVLLANAHCLESRDYPLMLGHNLLSLGLLFHPFDVSFHHSFHLFPLKSDLIWRFYHLRAAKVHPFLDFVPLSLTQVEHCHE